MSIKKLFGKDSEDKKYVSSFRRSVAASIDVWIVLFLRIFFMQLMGSLWLNHELASFMQEFQNEFGTDTIKNTPNHINFIIHNKIFIYSIIFYMITIMVGAIYHAYFNSSSWQGTIGKRVMKTMIIKENGLKISFTRAILHYLLSVAPFAFLLYLMSYKLRYDLSIYEALTHSQLNIVLGVIFISWVQIQLFTRKKVTAYDLICNTIFINGKTNYKFPWSKKSA
jgi:uncharacterized RDD family membrane protein YckC